MSPALLAYTLPVRHVLVLHSFHKGQEWNDDLSRGIIDGFANQEVELHFEYMDAKRFPEDEQFSNLYQLYRYKYRQNPVDVIVSTDESALDFLLKFREDLFPDTPVVFCGVKYLDGNKLFVERLITGITELVDIKKSIQLILKLDPEVQQVVIITDNSPTSIATIKAAMPVLKTFRHRLKFHFTELMTISSLEQQLSELPLTSAVLLVNFTKDLDGYILSMKESARLISRSSPVPVYALWDSYLGDGILGGVLVRGYTQGKTAAGMALQLLQGQSTEQMPVVKGMGGATLFDYQQLKRFRIPERRLPPDSVVTNRPVTFFYQYQRLIMSVLIGIVGLSLIIVLLSINIIKRRQVEKALKQHESELLNMSFHIIEAQEKERKRLSIDLHDEFGQTLTALGLNISLIKNKLGSNCNRLVSKRIEETAQAIENLYDQVHDLSLDLRPTILDDLGLAPTVRWYLNRYQERTGTQVHITVDEEPGVIIPDTIAVTFYRVLQEALTNSAKHARASVIHTALSISYEAIVLSLSDDGEGFDLEKVMSRSIQNRGLGLVGMRERIELLSGSFHIDTAPGKGTTLLARVALTGDKPNE